MLWYKFYNDIKQQSNLNSILPIEGLSQKRYRGKGQNLVEINNNTFPTSRRIHNIS
jgi:hypothetical protein